MTTTDTAIHIRTFRWDDLPGVVDVINRASRAKAAPDESVAFTDLTEIRFMLEHYFDAEQDCFVAENAEDDTLVGVATMRLSRPPGTGFGLCDVVPEVAGQGVGTRLLRATDQRLLAAWPPAARGDRPVRVYRQVRDTEQAAIQVFEAEGYTQTHAYARLELDLSGKAITPPDFPAGVELRPFDVMHHAKTLYTFDQAHDLFAELSFSQWMHLHHLHEAYFDPTWWPVAWDDQGVVGVVKAFADVLHDPPDFARIDFVVVRADRRRQGIATALLRQTFYAFQQRGITRVAVKEVDTDHPAGMVLLLERLGMCVVRRELEFSKMLTG